MSYYPEPDSYITGKVKVVLYFSNYTTKKKIIEYATDVDTPDLAAKKEFIVLKAKVGRLDNNQLVNVSISSNNLKVKVDDLDVVKLKTFPIDLRGEGEGYKWFIEEWSCEKQNSTHWKPK